MHPRLRTLCCAAVCALVLAACSLPLAAADAAEAGADGVMPDPDQIIRKILGFDEMAKNVCLISSHNMVNAADLPGRLVALSADRQVPSDLLRYSFRKPGAASVTQINPPTAPIQVTRLESSQVKGGSLGGWFGASLAKEDIAELRTIPLPATSISVDGLDEQAISERFSNVSPEVRKGLGIITDVIPYEVLASVCRKATRKVESGVWYIQLGKDTYWKQSDELRKYYLVAIYTPLVFYDDIGVIPNASSTSTVSDKRLPEIEFLTRKEALSLWLDKQWSTAGLEGFSEERHVGWADSPSVQGAASGGDAGLETKSAKPLTCGASTGSATSAQ